MNGSLTSMRKDFNLLHHLSVEEYKHILMFLQINSVWQGSLSRNFSIKWCIFEMLTQQKRGPMFLYCVELVVYLYAVLLGWGLQSQFSVLTWFSRFSESSECCLPFDIHIWQVSPQLSCGDTCQIWMWFKAFNGYWCKSNLSEWTNQRMKRG